MSIGLLQSVNALQNPTSEQYLRTLQLIVYGNNLQGVDLSNLRIKFSVKRSDTMTPNVADIKVYNVADDTAQNIFSNYSPRQLDTTTGLVGNRGHVILQAGYPGNYGVIFQGNIKQIILGRESATDTFMELICGDGDLAYNYSIVNTTLRTANPMEQINAASAPMASKGVTQGNIQSTPTNQTLPRGKVMFGDSKNYLRNVAQSTNQAWSIQDGKITFIPKRSYLSGTAVVLTSKTGMIGTPQQTTEGVNVKCLLNPMIQIGGRVQIDNKSIAKLPINLSIPNSPANIPAPLTADGVYYILVAEHTGDTRGIEWYTSLICLNVNVTANPINAVQGYTG